MDYIALPRDAFQGENYGFNKKIEDIKQYWGKVAQDLSKRVRETERITSKDLSVTVAA